MKSKAKALSPLNHSRTANAEKAMSVDLVGYFQHGHPIDMTSPVQVLGLMEVDTHVFGLLHFTCLQPCQTQMFFAQRFLGWTPVDADGINPPSVGLIPAGSRFYCHPHHVRAITMAPKEESHGKQVPGGNERPE